MKVRAGTRLIGWPYHAQGARAFPQTRYGYSRNPAGVLTETPRWYAINPCRVWEREYRRKKGGFVLRAAFHNV